MADLHHTWGNDILLGANGDLAVATGSEESRQRVLRRLLSAPGDLLFHYSYGAGLPKKVGETTKAANLEPTVRRQMGYEAAVSQSPPPTVKIIQNYTATTINITYRDAETAAPVGIGFTIES